MHAEQIEQLKSRYTDKYVEVDATRPELARFRDVVGQIKTVNMNGRALVQFLDYHLDISWHDIDLSCLKVVDPPSKDVRAKPEAKRGHDKPAGKAAPTAGDKQTADAAAGGKKLSPLEMARMQGAAGGKAAAAKPAAAKPAGGKPSTADILAAARGKAPAAKAETPAESPAAPAAAESSAGAPAAPAKVDRSKMSVAEMLAMARANKPASGGAAAPEAAAPAAPAAQPAAPEPAAPPAAAAPEPAAAESASAGKVGPVDKSGMSVAEMIAYCRQHDAS